MNMKHVVYQLVYAIGMCVGCATTSQINVAEKIETIADARRGTKSPVDLGEAKDSQGDLFVFDQPLLDQNGEEIGTNSGFCVRTRPGEYSECQWTLTFADGSIHVAGREAEKGPSKVAVVGGTGVYRGVTGELLTTPNSNGTFTQVLTIRRR